MKRSQAKSDAANPDYRRRKRKPEKSQRNSQSKSHIQAGKKDAQRKQLGQSHNGKRIAGKKETEQEMTKRSKKKKKKESQQTQNGGIWS